MTVRRVINILFYCFNLTNFDFHFQGNWVYLDEFLNHYPHLMEAPAGSVKIRFFGGAPSHWGWFNGSFATLLADKIMWARATDDKKQVQKIVALKI
jgi:hypothetical protein